MQIFSYELVSLKNQKVICGCIPIKIKRVEIGSKKWQTKDNKNNSLDDICVVVLL